MEYEAVCRRPGAGTAMSTSAAYTSCCESVSNSVASDSDVWMNTFMPSGEAPARLASRFGSLPPVGPTERCVVVVPNRS